MASDANPHGWMTARSRAVSSGRRPGKTLLATLFAVLLGVVPARGETISLPAGVVVQHDGAGGLSVIEGKDVLLRCELRWLSATDTSPAGTALTVDAGATLRGVETDGAQLSTADLGGGRVLLLGAKMRHWPYFHVDDIAFVDAALRVEDEAAPQGTVALGIESARPWELRHVRHRPHVGVGRAPWVEFDLLESVFERADGDRLYLGIVRLDRRAAVMLADDRGLMWEAGTPATWPLALIAARTRSSLEHLAGQALLTYDRAGAADTTDAMWKVPPLCGRCRDPRIEELRAELRVREGMLQLELKMRDNEAVDSVSPEGLRVEGVPFARFFQRARGKDAEYAIALTDPAAKRLADAAARGTLDVEVWTCAEVGVRPQRVDLVVEATVAEAMAQARTSRESPLEVLPSYLSPSLVSSWPNPFRGETTIEVTVPSTLGEAFELDEKALARVSPDEPVPFGTAPTVRVRVYNVSGQLVQMLSEEVRSTGQFSVQWNGTDAQGQVVAAGAYYVNVEMGDWSVTRRVLRLAP